jgi:hypothetical protein
MIQARKSPFIFESDCEAANHRYRGIFRLEVLIDLVAHARSRGILRVPAATIEFVDSDHERMVDQLTVGGSLDQRERMAVKVDER